jgi:hypothetical protein
MSAVFSPTPDKPIENSVTIYHLFVNGDYMLTIVLCYFHHIRHSELLYFVSNPVTTGQSIYLS